MAGTRRATFRSTAAAMNEVRNGSKGASAQFLRPGLNARFPFSQEIFAGTHMWTAPVSQGLQREMTFWSIAVICPAFVCGTDGHWPRWGARIGSQTRQ